uniref:Uncharacterized protein n=1 Tax=Arundo donax TaxID=35708 RepID=A0A0A9BYR0_ARUDO
MLANTFPTFSRNKILVEYKFFCMIFPSFTNLFYLSI